MTKATDDKVLDLVRLQSRTGDLIGDFEIPIYRERPAVLLWAARVFQHIGAGYYVETFAVNVLSKRREPRMITDETPRPDESVAQHKARINGEDR